MRIVGNKIVHGGKVLLTGDFSSIFDTKSRSGPALKFKGFCTAFDLDVEETRTKLNDEYIGSLPDFDEPVEVVEEVEKCTSWEALEKVCNVCLPGRVEDLKIILTTMLSLWFTEEDFIYLALVSPRSSGKSTLLNACKSDLALLVNEVTQEAFAPGTANEDQSSHALLDEVPGKTLVVHDLSPMLTKKDERVEQFFGMLEGAYGRDSYVKFSPGAGLQEFRGGGFNAIFGLTPDRFNKTIKYFTSIGRFLFYNLSAIDDKTICLTGKNHVNKTELNKHIRGFIKHMKTADKHIEISSSVRHEMVELLEETLEVNLVWKDKKKNKDDKEVYKYHEYKKEPMIRRFGQIEILCKTYAFIEGRTEVTLEDARKFIRMLNIDNDDDYLEKLEYIPK